MSVAYISPDRIKCHGCGVPTPVDLIDAKPGRGQFAGEQLNDAAARGAQFQRLECQTCYGPGWSALS